MMVSTLLHWYELIFLLPLGLSALMLLLSAVRLGHHGAQGAHHGGAHLPAHAAAGHHVSAAHAPAHHGPAHPGQTHHQNTHHGTADKTHHVRQGAQRQGISASPMTLIVWIVGANRAPLPIMLEAFGLAWGVCGFLANAVFIPVAIVAPLGILPSLGVAAAGGVIGSRIASELYARFMPKDGETYVVSREGLFGLTGQVAFPVSETTGRILVYDDHGTLHDEFCRVKPGGGTINKGAQARIVDVDAQGRILVEEA